MRISLFFLLVLMMGSNVIAQSRLMYSGFAPEVKLSFAPAKNLKFTAKIESQQGIVSKLGSEAANWEHFHYRTDFQGLISAKANEFISITGGYQYRWEGDDMNSHRAIQQISFTQQMLRYKLGHRVRTDQTFSPSDSPEFRLRYRIAAEIPLQGQSLDPGEFYFVISGEPIYSYQSGTSGLENRLKCLLGFCLKNNHELEVGIDSRIDRLLEPGSRHRLWIVVGWSVSL